MKPFQTHPRANSAWGTVQAAVYPGELIQGVLEVILCSQLHAVVALGRGPQRRGSYCRGSSS